MNSKVKNQVKAWGYGSPGYYVQKMYTRNMGDVTLDTFGVEKAAAEEGIYYSASFSRKANAVLRIGSEQG